MTNYLFVLLFKIVYTGVIKFCNETLNTSAENCIPIFNFITNLASNIPFGQLQQTWSVGVKYVPCTWVTGCCRQNVAATTNWVYICLTRCWPRVMSFRFLLFANGCADIMVRQYIWSILMYISEKILVCRRYLEQ